ncbi:hypothetical protein FRC10_006295 [Ceratobasidium sp. 414]|nr:hypothetical protein FRC10_006295 [Ceratobasidium sp. 414]
MPDPDPELEGDGPALGEGLLSNSDLLPVPEEGKDLGAKSKGRGQGGKKTGQGGSQSGGQDSDQDEEFNEEFNGQGNNQVQGGGIGQGRGSGQAQGQHNASEGSGPGLEMRQQTTPGESTSGGVMAGKQMWSHSKADASASIALTSGSAPSNKGNRKAGN